MTRADPERRGRVTVNHATLRADRTVRGWSAWQSLERHLTVVTVDADFQRVPELNVLLLTRTELRVRQ